MLKLTTALEVAFWMFTGHRETWCTCNQTAPEQINEEYLNAVFYDETIGRQEKVELGPGSLWISCKHKLAARFEYVARCDNGCFTERKKLFALDYDSPKECRQRSSRSYPVVCVSPLCWEQHCEGFCRSQCGGLRRGSVWTSESIPYEGFSSNCDHSIKYDRGHQIPTNHLDYNTTLMKLSNNMMNISPQASRMNRGAWLYTEKLTECWRDIEVLHIRGGSVWNSFDNEKSMEGRNEWFRESHGVQTPVYFWKVIRAKQNGIISTQLGIHHIAFWIPNSELSVSRNINAYVITLKELQENLFRYGEKVTFNEKQQESCYGGNRCEAWPVPEDCDLSEFRIIV